MFELVSNVRDHRSRHNRGPDSAVNETEPHPIYPGFQVSRVIGIENLTQNGVFLIGPTTPTVRAPCRGTFPRTPGAVSPDSREIGQHPLSKKHLLMELSDVVLYDFQIFT